jgi:hypothetical protein
MKKKLVLLGILVLMIAAGGVYAKDITFEWDRNTENDLIGYRLYQSNVSGSYVYGTTSPNFKIGVAQCAAPGPCRATITGVGPGTFFWVATAHNATVESAPSNEVTLKIPTTASNLKIQNIK